MATRPAFGPALADPAGEGGGEEARVDPVHQDGEPALAGDAVLAGQVLAEEAEVRRAPAGDVLAVVAVGEGTTDDEEQDFRQRMQDPPHVARIPDLGDVIEQRSEAGLPGKGFGGDHGRLRIRAAASTQEISLLSSVI